MNDSPKARMGALSPLPYPTPSARYFVAHSDPGGDGMAEVRDMQLDGSAVAVCTAYFAPYLAAALNATYPGETN